MAEAVPEYNIITGRKNTVFPSRQDTMYLSSIPNRSRNLKISRITNQTSDIDKAQPRMFSQMYTRGMPDLYNTQDISGAQPQALHSKLNKPHYNLRNDDIEGSQAKPYTFKTTRSVDPNDPQYKLPTVHLEPPPPPRFTRDQISVADIEGAGPKPPRVFKPRDNISTHDIEGAQAGWKPRYRRREGPARNSLDVSDILKEGFTTKRSTNPLNPVHTINGMVHKDDEGQRPRAAPKGIGKDFNLHTEDIDGAYPGWKAPHHIDGGFRGRGRKNYRMINETKDIRGAQADTTHNYILTKRVTNPLEPKYVGLDGYPYEQSPPVTPAYDVNRPPAVVREAMETKRKEREEADELSRSLHLR